MAAATIDPHFDRKLEVVTAGLAREFCSKLQNKISREGASTIMDYMISLNSEVSICQLPKRYHKMFDQVLSF
jgi:hypothetical protein